MKAATHLGFSAQPDSFLRAHGGVLQRKCSCNDNGVAHGECAEYRKNHEIALQRRTAGALAPGFAPSIVHEVLRTPGRPLDEGTREFMESRFHHEFSGVRVHADSRAADSARVLNARAYTAGRELVFGPGEYQPGSPEGRQLLAHELAHVVQQGGATPAGALLPVGSESDPLEQEADAAATAVAGIGRPPPLHTAGCGIQRDLATPLPEEPQRVQPDLTDAQIREAIRYNSQFYNETNTRLIQSILGGPVTGRWTADNIRAIAATQEQYGLKKDGKVGADTFQFIMHEQELEGAGTETENCLTAFRVVWHPVESNATPGPNGTTVIRGHHVVEARFSSRCDCSEFQYRQFIAGVATATQGTNTTDLSGFFHNIPGHHLPITMQEDGMTQCAGQNYGHREQPGQAQTTGQCGENHYMDDTGATDQAHGCVYRGEDFPQINVSGLNTGDVVDLLVQFRGEIRRNNHPVQTKNWTDIDTSVTTP